MSVASQSAARFEGEPPAVPPVAPRRRAAPFVYVTGMAAFVVAILARMAKPNPGSAMLQRLRSHPSLLDDGPPAPDRVPFAGAERFGA